MRRWGEVGRDGGLILFQLHLKNRAKCEPPFNIVYSVSSPVEGYSRKQISLHESNI